MAVSKTGRRKVKIWFVLLIIIGVAVLGTAIALLADAPGRQELQTLAIGNIDFTKLQDGTYVGEYNGAKGDSRNATVEVIISGGKITEINILKGAIDSDGNPAELIDGMTIGDLFKRVIESKALQVDAISGATLTSKAHLKALENALIQAQKQ
ncbi:FMN-binding domain protein [Clostridium homopropionicum DSM 5847]|uniref:FMN-binding domain protein n=1 Tax=Clostridium homopropionicum DSM 5847 TaxID=1121318 RepID=A0A0L6ZC28_9CLOT|nr:FMN-binding protein [Clostridium homopropionicum]KOA20343.1 FMN-binding domain protein [Clostridium homopropionicum DSM 5847]SFG94163.1 FMN-binding domain-containing protein [Clostridium homopropionicum]